MARRTYPVTLAGERLYSIAELAELWQISRDTIERMLRRGELRYVQVGTRGRRIPASSLTEYLAERGIERVGG